MSILLPPKGCLQKNAYYSWIWRSHLPWSIIRNACAVSACIYLIFSHSQGSEGFVLTEWVLGAGPHCQIWFQDGDEGSFTVNSSWWRCDCFRVCKWSPGMLLVSHHQPLTPPPLSVFSHLITSAAYELIVMEQKKPNWKPRHFLCKLDSAFCPVT